MPELRLSARFRARGAPLAAYASALSMVCAGAATARGPGDVKQLVRDGQPIFVEALNTVGTIERGERYIVRFDSKAGKMHVSHLDTRKLASYPFSAADADKGLSLWGARFAWREGPKGLCLDYDPETGGKANVTCDARVIGPALPDQFSSKKDLITVGAERLITQLSQHLADPDAVVKRGRPCPTKPKLVQTHIGARFLADALYMNGSMLPFITDPAQRAKAEDLVDRGIAHLLKTVPPSARTTYTDCYNGVDLITPFHVARALDQMDRLERIRELPRYVAAQWRSLVAEEAIEKNGARNAEERTQFANGFAAYLHVATIAERHGVKALQPYTDRGVQLLLAEQTLQRGQTCTDPLGKFEQPFGGWPHSPQECSQNVGYHGFIVGGLIALHEHYTAKGICSREPQRCRALERSLSGALDWIGGLAEGPKKAALVDRARRTSTKPSPAGSGNVGGADTGFRIMAYLGIAPRNVRPVLINALDESVEARPAYLPIGSYLRAVSATKQAE